jgi:hypothetical protein
VQSLLTRKDVQDLLQVMKSENRPAVIDWNNRTIRVLSETKTHPTKILSTGPMTYEDILFEINAHLDSLTS